MLPPFTPKFGEFAPAARCPFSEKIHARSLKYDVILRNDTKVVPYAPVAGHRMPDVRIQTALNAKRYPVTGKTA